MSITLSITIIFCTFFVCVATVDIVKYLTKYDEDKTKEDL